MIEVLPFFLILTLMILEITMNPFKNISIFRDQICNCFPWNKDKKLTRPWQPRLDYRELNDDPELKPTPFPEKQQYDMDYKFLLKENSDYKSLLEENDRVLGDLLEENERLDLLVKSLILQLSKVAKELVLNDSGVDGTPRNK